MHEVGSTTKVHVFIYSWVHYETGFGVPDFQNQMHQQLK